MTKGKVASQHGTPYTSRDCNMRSWEKGARRSLHPRTFHDELSFVINLSLIFRCDIFRSYSDESSVTSANILVVWVGIQLDQTMILWFLESLVPSKH